MVSRNSLIFFTATACILLLIVTECSAIVVSNAHSVNIKSGTLEIKLDRQTGQPQIGGLKITEGPGAAPLRFTNPVDWKIGSKSASYNLIETGGDISLHVEYHTSDYTRIVLGFSNNGSQKRLLEVGYVLFEAGDNLKWWDGRMESEPGTDEMSYDRILLRLPMSAVYSDKHGTAVGMDPHQYSSMFAAGAEHTNGGLLVNYRTRIVLDPGQKLTISLYAFSFIPKYGYLDAVQRLHDMYPDVFNRAPGVRPIMRSAGGYLFSGKDARHLQYEEARRYGQGWEWAYQVWQKYGSAYPNEHTWDMDIGYAGDIDAHVPRVKGTLEDFRRDMRERFHNGWPGTALAYYIMPNAGDERVMKDYPDSLVLDAQGAPSTWFTVSQGKVAVRNVYPWGNRYGRQVIEDIANIAADFQPSAIAFDEAYRMDAQYGGGIEGDQGRSWDNAGNVFCSLQVALSRLLDNVHTHKVRGYTMGTACNKPWTYMTATRADVAMHEWVPWENLDSALSLRLLLGNKAMSWWQELNLTGLIKWESLPPEQITEAVIGVYDYVTLISFKYGAIPANFQIRGSKSLTEMMPALTELCMEGWQAVPAAKGDEGLWLSRYGKVVRTFIAVGNRKREPRRADLKIDTQYLGKGHFLFSDYKGDALEARSADGVESIDAGILPPHGQIIARALVQIETKQDSRLTGNASFTSEASTTGNVEANWNITRNRKPIAKANESLSIRLPNGAVPGILTLNGIKCRYTASNGAVIYNGPVPDRCNLRLTFKPSISIKTQTSKLTAFPFVVDNKANASIRLPNNAVDMDRFSAQRISSYFEWFYRRQSAPAVILWDLPKNGPAVLLPIRESSAPIQTPYTIELKQSTGPTAISLSADSKRLIISGRTAEERDSAVLKLLSMLDKRYPFYGVLPDTPIYQKAGLAGKYVP